MQGFLNLINWFFKLLFGFLLGVSSPRFQNNFSVMLSLQEKSTLAATLKTLVLNVITKKFSR